jgi:DNA/RNA-binding domain of Phe-tRNA-synthetase-like protein
MLTITATPDWQTAYPGAVIGLLEVSGVDNSSPSPTLEEEKRRVEAQLRVRFQGSTRGDFLALPVMAAYHSYYRRFDKTYHVLLQFESLILKGRNLPQVSPLVDANFATEMESLALAAGHDVARLEPPLSIDICRQGETLTQMAARKNSGDFGGAIKAQLPGDMAMRDRDGIACTILYGQDDRSPITALTTHALYVVYAPPGVGQKAVTDHLEGLLGRIRLFAPGVRVEQLTLLTA